MTSPSSGLPIGDAVQFGWEKFKENALFIVAIQIAAMIAVSIVNSLYAVSEHIGWFYEYAMWIADLILGMVINLGAIKIALRYRDGKAVEFSNMFDSFDILPSFTVAAIFAGLAVGFGLMFLLIPGIVLYVRFLFYGYVILDEQPGPVDALQRSFEITRGRGLDLFLFVMLLLGLNFLGFLCLAVGLFVTIPVSYGATAYIYRHIRPQPASGSV